MEQTLIILKPDALDRGLVGECIARFEKANLRIVTLQALIPDKSSIDSHYSHLKQDIRDEIYAYMVDKTVIAIILSGDNAISKGRKIIGATEPLEAAMGTIRGDFGSSSYSSCKTKHHGYRAVKNLIHASESEESYNKEIKIWFPD